MQGSDTEAYPSQHTRPVSLMPWKPEITGTFPKNLGLSGFASKDRTYHNKVVHVTPALINNVIYLAVKYLGPQLRILPTDVTVRCLRASGANALLCAGVDTDVIRLLGLRRYGRCYQGATSPSSAINWFPHSKASSSLHSFLDIISSRISIKHLFFSLHPPI